MTGFKSAVAWVSSLVVSLALVATLIGTWGWLAYGSPYAITALAQTGGDRPAGSDFRWRDRAGRKYRVAVDRSTSARTR